MAYREFYMQTTGSDMNSGTTNTDAATITSTNGGTSGTGSPYTFTAASGTPFASVTVGDWASVFLDGATTPVYYAKIDSIGGAGASITMGTTAAIGSAPAAAATGRTCKVGGAWASALALGLGGSISVIESTRINIKAGTYTDSSAGGKLAASRTGTVAFPVWLRGYRTSPGDLDNDTLSVLVAGTDIPLFNYTAAASIAAGAYQAWSFIAVSSSGSGSYAFSSAVSTGVNRIYRCQFRNTNNASGSMACQASLNSVFVRCYFFAAALSAGVVRSVNANATTLIDCVIEGGAIGVLNPSTATVLVDGCVITGFTGSGISQSTANSPSKYMRNTINGSSSTNGFLFLSPTTTLVGITNNLISNVTNIINDTTTGDLLRLYANSRYNYTNFVVNQGDYPDFQTVSEASSPYFSSSILIPDTKAVNGNNLQVFEGLSILTSVQIGAVERDTMIGFRR